MQDVPAANHRDNVGGIEDMLFIDGVRAGSDPGIRIWGAELDTREIIGFRKLPAKLGGITLVQCQVNKEVALPGIAEPGFVNEGGADVPDVGDLRVVVVNIA